jgi:hypothetical protein
MAEGTMNNVDESSIQVDTPSWGVLDLNYAIFDGNFRELVEWIGSITRHEALLDRFARPAPLDRDTAIALTARRLHNVLSSGRTLDECTEAVIKESYDTTAVARDYAIERARQITEHDFIWFVHELCNTALHQRLPVIMAGFNRCIEPHMGETYSGAGFRLERGVLIALSERSKHGWDVRAQRYLVSLSGNQIDIGDLGRRYHEHLTAFYLWMRERRRQDTAINPGPANQL